MIAKVGGVRYVTIELTREVNRGAVHCASSEQKRGRWPKKL